jgi:hypothetical protein
MGPRTCLNILENRKISCPCWILTPERPAPRLVAVPIPLFRLHSVSIRYTHPWSRASLQLTVCIFIACSGSKKHHEISMVRIVDYQVKRTIRRRRRPPQNHIPDGILSRPKHTLKQAVQIVLPATVQSSTNNFLQLKSHQEQFNSKPINVAPIFYRYWTCSVTSSPPPHPPRNGWYTISSRGNGKRKIYLKETYFCIEVFFLSWIPQQVCRQHTKLVPQSLWELGMLESIRIW